MIYEAICETAATTKKCSFTYSSGHDMAIHQMEQLSHYDDKRIRTNLNLEEVYLCLLQVLYKTIAE